jgi:hypothetical protein
MKIRQAGVELYHTYVRTERLTKLIVDSHILENVSNKIPSLEYSSALSLGRHVVRPPMALRTINDPISTPRTIKD